MKNFLSIILLFIFLMVISQSFEQRMLVCENSNLAELSRISDLLKREEVLRIQRVNSFRNQNPLFIEPPGKQLMDILPDGTPLFFETHSNAQSAQVIRATSMYPGGPLGLNVTGLGLTAGIWDGGGVFTSHVEIDSKVINGDGASGNTAHPTHVTGTIIARGINPTLRGIAYNADGVFYDWTNDLDEMTTFAINGYIISNHSYGNTNTAVWQWGRYDTRSATLDNILFNAPFYLAFRSAGNHNNQSPPNNPSKGGYDLLMDIANAKNNIVVANANHVIYTGPASVTISPSSSWGPSDDGRIKPDITARGVNITSLGTANVSSTATMSGTSMASPAVAGLGLLLQNHWSNLHSGQFMRSATLRGLLLATADECGDDPGPDYRFGWGLANGDRAARVISARGVNSIIEELTLNNFSTYTRTFSINSPANLRIAICWTDRPGSAAPINVEDFRTPRLINNLDLKVIRGSTTYFPWKLDPDFPWAAATNNSDNDVDNIEVIDIPNAPAGTYTIQVSHKGTLTGGSQNFTLLAFDMNVSNSFSALSNDEINPIQSIFSIYPNPTVDRINIMLNEEKLLDSCEVYDITGRLMFFRNFTPNNQDFSFDVSSLEKGVYIMKITSGNDSYFQKFVKQ